MNSSVFLDTSFSIALSVVKDEFHPQAIKLTKEINAAECQIITTRAVILEIGNALSKLKYRQSAVAIIESLKNDPNVIIVSLSDELFDKAFELFRNRSDKEWGLVDCISFVIMHGQNIESALTADEHFIQAGFRALLRED
jgi:uncharacterized protein